MEALLLQVFYLLRPLLNARWFDLSLLGFSFFELAGLFLTFLLGVAFASSLMRSNRVPVSAIEIWAAILMLWIAVVSFLHPSLTDLSTVAKWVLPLLTFIFLRRILIDRSSLVPLVYLLVLGFAIPFSASVFLTVQGEGLDQVVYWTGTERYQGVYSGIHEMGHNSAFAMMLVVIYVAICKTRGIDISNLRYLVLAAIFFSAAYLLFHTHLRTAYLGLAVFAAVTLAFCGIRYLFAGLIAAVIALAFLWPTVSTIFFDVLNPEYTGAGFERAGSGRIGIWINNLEIWLAAPLEYKVAGLGIGNYIGNRIPLVSDPFPQIRNSHNDWLQALMEMGIVGFGLIAGLFLAIFNRILQHKGTERAAFLGFFAAVVAMNLMSNSYLQRVALGQMFFMVIVYVDLYGRRVPNGKVGHTGGPGANGV